VDHITFDIFFRDEAGYERAKQSGLFDPDRLAPVFRIAPERFVTCVAFDPARAIKFTIRRTRPSGSPGESDLFGAQQYAPLFELEIP
jgi:hypothetical protein